MEIEFFSDNEECHNVRFSGDCFAKNEAILSAFYDCYSERNIRRVLQDIEYILDGNKDIELQFGDLVDVEVNGKYLVLSSEYPPSKKYKLTLVEMKRVLELWQKFIATTGKNLKVVNISVEVFN